MKRIDDYATLAPLLAAQLRRGVRTNAFAAPAEYRDMIASGALSVQELPDGLLLFRDRGAFHQMYFYLQGETPQLAFQKPIVTEIAMRPQDAALRETASQWQALGFRVMLTRRRLMRPKGLPLEASGTETAGLPDAPAIFSLMQDCFDPMAGELPTRSELEEILSAGNLICVRDNAGAVAGILHIAPGRGKTELRHLAVRADCRRQGMAETLVRSYLKKTGFEKSLVWVRQGNTAAENVYKKNGYAPDGWTSTVLCHGG